METVEVGPHGEQIACGCFGSEISESGAGFEDEHSQNGNEKNESAPDEEFFEYVSERHG